MVIEEILYHLNYSQSYTCYNCILNILLTFSCLDDTDDTEDDEDTTDEDNTTGKLIKSHIKEDFSST